MNPASAIALLCIAYPTPGSAVAGGMNHALGLQQHTAHHAAPGGGSA